MRRPLALAAAALCCVLAGALAFSVADHAGFWLALYWSVATATTVGYGDVTPKSGPAHITAIAVMLTAIPLLAAAFAALTSFHVSRHVRANVDRRLDEHHQAIHERLDRIERQTREDKGTADDQ